MDENIEFLRDFLEYDSYRIAELIDKLSFPMRQLGQYLRRHVEGPFLIVYRDETDPMYELIELLDGNNFEVEYGHRSSTFLMDAAEVTPLYMETIEVQYEQEPEAESVTVDFDFNYDEWIPEKHNSILRGLRATTLLIDDISFYENLLDESLKPPQRRKE